MKGTIYLTIQEDTQIVSFSANVLRRSDQLGTDLLEDPDIQGAMILRRTFKENGKKIWTGLI
jgi:hypothetical protein